MSGEERREEIARMIHACGKPVSGSRLAEHFGVSRQVIVQDIALLRAQGICIHSTNRGYVCLEKADVTRVFYVHHSNDQILEEMDVVVDNGGEILDVFVRHAVYGELRAPLAIDSRKKVRVFLKNIENGFSAPLNNLTSGFHYHTVRAKSEEDLDVIEAELKELGILAEER